jgi:hypothetical protein
MDVSLSGHANHGSSTERVSFPLQYTDVLLCLSVFLGVRLKRSACDRPTSHSDE